MGFELRHKGKREKKGQKRSQDFHKALNKLCASQILGGGETSCSIIFTAKMD